ncbi:MAG: ankyrin repeat domain-containing protein [Planctomycetota bacterium]
MIIDACEPLAVEIIGTIRQGDHQKLLETLRKNPRIAGVIIYDREQDTGRSLLHIATDWPGQFPGVSKTIEMITAAGCDPDVRMQGPHTETPLHWAASSDDTDAINALVNSGADLELSGSVTDGGTALSNAVNFGQWHAAELLVQLGAQTNLYQAAALGLVTRVTTRLGEPPLPIQAALDYAFWMACSRGKVKCRAVAAR